MKIIDNFFSEEDVIKVKKLIHNELSTVDRSNKKHEHGEEFVDLGLENSKLYILYDDVKLFFLETLIEKNFIIPSVLDHLDVCNLRYHETKYPYRSLLHKDRLEDWDKEIIDYFGINFYLHENWNFEDGGIYFYKKDKNDSFGNFIEPKYNRLVINELDHWHGVTMITNPNVVRKSLNFFIPYEFQKKYDLY